MKKIFKLPFLLVALLITGCAVDGNSTISSMIVDSVEAEEETLNEQEITDIFDQLSVKYAAKSTQFEANLEDVEEDEEEVRVVIEERVSNFKEFVNSSGTLTAAGDSFEVVEMEDGCTGIANSGSYIGFRFNQKTEESYLRKEMVSVEGGEEEREIEYKLIDSKEKKIRGYDVGDKIKSGGVVILKSFDKENWEKVIYQTDINGDNVDFTPAAEDVFKGVYYKFINVVRYEFISKFEMVTKGFWWTKREEEEAVYDEFNLEQEYMIYVANDTQSIRYTCKSVEEYSFDSEEYDEEQISLMQQATTLTNNSVSTSYINVTLGNVKSNTHEYYHFGPGGIVHKAITEDIVFTDPGKYTFVTKTAFGTKKERTMYIINPGNDNGLSTFFANGIVDSSKRVFNLDKKCQTYMINSSYTIPELSNYLPARYGNIYYFEDEVALANKTGSVIKTIENNRELITGTFDKQGYYVFDFTVSPEGASGDILHYMFTYYVTAQTSYAPAVNYSLLTSHLRSNLYSTKVYAVMLPTTGGGSYQFIFPYSSKYINEAKELAVEIEELSVEIVNKDDSGEEKCYFYKSIDNPLTKTNYLNKLALYEAINYYANQNLSVVYLENDIPFGTKIVEDENLKDIQNTSLRTSVRVVSNRQVLNDLRTNEYYLNGFKFTQIADYEVTSVTLTDEDNVVHNVGFDQDLSNLFDKNQKVKVTETNWNGSNTYDAIFQKNNSCSIGAKVDGADKVYTIQDNGKKVSASSFEFITAVDLYDSQTLIAVSNGDTRVVFSMSEVAGLTLPQGEYNITAINRQGQTYEIKVSCTGTPSPEAKSLFAFNHDPLKDETEIEYVSNGSVSDLPDIRPSKSAQIWKTIGIVAAGVVSGVIVVAIFVFAIHIKSKNSRGLYK